MKFISMTSSYLSNPGATFSQTVTYNNNAFLPADTKSIVYIHTHSLQRWSIKTERFTTGLEAESQCQVKCLTSRHMRMQIAILYI